VVFASSLFGCCFTLGSFTKKYAEMANPSTPATKHSHQVKTQALDPAHFQKFLWGDIFYKEDTRKFIRKQEGGLPRSFVHFILEPFYKLVSSTISNEKAELLPVIKRLGVYLHKKDYQLDIKPLLKVVLSRFFGDTSCLVDCLVASVRTAAAGTLVKVQNYYRNSSDDSKVAT
jgi:U5 small nuclear ribonucleoprotein component